MPGKPSPRRSACTSGVIYAEVLGDDRQLAELGAPRRRTRAPPGPCCQWPVHRASSRRAAPPSRRRSRGSGRRGRGRRARTCAGSARSTSGSRARHRLPVVERVAPQLARRRRRRRAARRRRRRRGTAPARRLVGRPGRDVDRHVADQQHAALGGVARAAPPTRGRSAPGRRPRRPRRLPAAIQNACARAEGVDLGVRDRGVGVREQPAPRRERRRRLVRRAVAVGRPERQHLPHALARRRQPVDERVRLRTEAAGRAARWDAAGRRCVGELHGGRFSPRAIGQDARRARPQAPPAAAVAKATAAKPARPRAPRAGPRAAPARRPHASASSTRTRSSTPAATPPSAASATPSTSPPTSSATATTS